MDTATIQTVALVATAVLSLLIVAFGPGLIGAETRDDDAVLSAVGASPNTRRSLTAARAGTLTLLGAVLAVPAGLIPVWGLSTTVSVIAAVTLALCAAWLPGHPHSGMTMARLTVVLFLVGGGSTTLLG